MLKMGRQRRCLRAEVLLQPLADGVADPSAGAAIDWLAIDWLAIHDSFRFAFIST
jgi:hypothetical protein